MALNQQIAKAIRRKGIYYYFLPTYKQAKQVVWDSLVDEHIPKEVIVKKNDSELAIYYINGSIQRFVGCEDIDKHRGINPIDAVFDEYSEMNPEIWTAIVQPVLRENHGTASFIFTPKGKNHAFNLLQLAKQYPEEWFYSVKGVNDTKAMSDKELEMARLTTPQALFKQEYDCEFTENAGAVFRRVRENVYDWEEGIEQHFQYQLGIDLAKYQDWTVITPFNVNNFHVLKPERFNQVDYNLVESRIEAAARRYNNAMCRIDSTGVGDPVFDHLSAQGIGIEPFRFTELSRKQLIDNLAILLEQDKIKIPNDEQLINELESFQYTLTNTNKIKAQVPDGLHDDMVMSLALAVWGVQNPVRIVSNDDQIQLYTSTYN